MQEINKNKYGALLVARLSSSRLPRKNILPIVSKPMIELLYERVSYSKNLSKIVICTSDEKSDDELEDLCLQRGWDCFRGSLDDIMLRQVKAAEKYNIENIVEILGDNPLVHSEIIDSVISLYDHSDCDYSANLTKEYEGILPANKLFSVGLRVQVYKTKIAETYKSFEVHKNPDLHPSSFIYNSEEFKSKFLEADDEWSYLNRPDLNFAVNYPKNFLLARLIFESIYHNDKNFDLKKVFSLLDSQPYLYNLFGPE
mgnify:CR=1 FL=1|tara:strand:+ start:1034 stop:1801 length:768 start_codon:yes stop_codon:yes gene_type:complete